MGLAMCLGMATEPTSGREFRSNVSYADDVTALDPMSEYQLINEGQAAQASYLYGGCVNLVSTKVPCTSTYTYGKIGGKTVKIMYASINGIQGWYWSYP